MTEILTGIGAIIIGIFLSLVLLKKENFLDVNKKQEECEKLIEKSKEEAARVLSETTQRAEKIKTYLIEESKKNEEIIKRRTESLNLREDIFKKRETKINETKLRIASYKEETQSMKNTIDRTEKKISEDLSAKTGLSKESVKEKILEKYAIELKEENQKKLAAIEETLKEDAIKKAKSILINTMQRLSLATSVESRSVLIKVPKDAIKGKIVGKEGKNIELFESLLEVAVVFNDLPNTISISAFNLVIRRIAEKAMEKLIAIQRDIDSEVIKRIIKEAERETDEELYEIGKKVLEKMGIESKDKNFTRTIGRLQYRTSYGQNIMKHSMEVGWIATMLGSELGINTHICRVGGFLHDLGKAIDQDPNIKGTHDTLTKELMEKYGFSKEEIHAAWTHHDAAKQETPEALIVKAADAISGGRPGARQDSIERYMERMEAIDETISSFEGVKKTFIMSAGREVRIFVNPETINDNGIEIMAKGIAKKLEENVTYPGKIKVNVIRRTKNTEIAK